MIIREADTEYLMDAEEAVELARGLLNGVSVALEDARKGGEGGANHRLYLPGGGYLMLRVKTLAGVERTARIAALAALAAAGEEGEG